MQGKQPRKINGYGFGAWQRMLLHELHSLGMSLQESLTHGCIFTRTYLANHGQEILHKLPHLLP